MRDWSEDPYKEKKWLYLYNLFRITQAESFSIPDRRLHLMVRCSFLFL